MLGKNSFVYIIFLLCLLKQNIVASYATDKKIIKSISNICKVYAKIKPKEDCSEISSKMVKKFKNKLDMSNKDIKDLCEAWCESTRATEELYRK